MIEKKVRSLKDQNFHNELGLWVLAEGQVEAIRFKNPAELNAHIEAGNFELAEGEEIRKNIQVLHKKESAVPAENELLSNLELTGNLDKLEKPETEVQKIDPLYSKEVKKDEKQNPWTTAVRNAYRGEPRGSKDLVEGHKSEVVPSRRGKKEKRARQDTGRTTRRRGQFDEEARKDS